MKKYCPPSQGAEFCALVEAEKRQLQQDRTAASPILAKHGSKLAEGGGVVARTQAGTAEKPQRKKDLSCSLQLEHPGRGRHAHHGDGRDEPYARCQRHGEKRGLLFSRTQALLHTHMGGGAVGCWPDPRSPLLFPLGPGPRPKTPPHVGGVPRRLSRPRRLSPPRPPGRCPRRLRVYPRGAKALWPLMLAVQG